MGFVPIDLARKGTNIDIDIRGRHVPNATVTPMPFYRRPRP